MAVPFCLLLKHSPFPLREGGKGGSVVFIKSRTINSVFPLDEKPPARPPLAKL